MPEGITEDDIWHDRMLISEGTEAEILANLTGPRKNLPEKPDFSGRYYQETEIGQHLIEEWEVNSYILQYALANGGSLWGWKINSWQGIAVIKDKRVLAVQATIHVKISSSTGTE